MFREDASEAEIEERPVVIFFFTLKTPSEGEPPKNVTVACTDLVDKNTSAHKQGFAAVKEAFDGFGYSFLVGKTIPLIFQNEGVGGGTGIYEITKFTLESNFFTPDYTINLLTFKSHMEQNNTLMLLCK